MKTTSLRSVEVYAMAVLVNIEATTIGSGRKAEAWGKTPMRVISSTGETGGRSMEAKIKMDAASISDRADIWDMVMYKTAGI